MQNPVPVSMQHSSNKHFKIFSIQSMQPNATTTAVDATAAKYQPQQNYQQLEPQLNLAQLLDSETLPVSD